MDKQTKKWLIVAGIILVLLIAFGIYWYKRGKKTTSIAPIIKDNPGSTAADNNPAGVSDTDIKFLATNLHTDMSGSNFWGHNDDYFQHLLELSDTDFERVYNAFNTEYQAESGQTLIQWVDGENDFFGGGAFASLKQAILARGKKLNLK